MVKHVSNEEAASCFEIWHSHWKNGSFIPAVRGKRKTRARKPRSRAGSSEDDADARLRTKRGTSFVISWATKPAKTSTGLRNDIDAASQANKKRPCRILQKKPPAKLAKKLK
ncbi:hypothetical protein PI126_g20178 [Phytophthora idaei]|nr:hypothetical protein PI126_g20178 [Phytophthora idaei]